MNWIGAHEASFPGLIDKLASNTEEPMKEEHDLDTSEEVKKPQRDPMLEAADWSRLAGLSQKVYEPVAEGELEEDILPFGWGDTSPAEMMSKLRKNFPNDPRWGNEEGEAPPVSGTISRELPSDGGPDGGGLGDRYSPPTKDGVSPPTRRIGEADAPSYKQTPEAAIAALMDLRQLQNDPGAQDEEAQEKIRAAIQMVQAAIQEFDGGEDAFWSKSNESMRETYNQARLANSVNEEWEDEGLDDRSAAQQLDKMLADGQSLLSAAQKLASYYGVEPYEVVQAGEYYGSMETKKLLAGFRKLLGTDSVEEGNEFTGALAKAKAAGAEEFEVDGKRYKVKEAEMFGQANIREPNKNTIIPGENTEERVEEGMADVMGDEEIKDPFPELPQVAHDGDADSYADKYSDDGSRVGTQGKDTADDELSWIKRALGNK
jgi:hypothetical protein